MIKKNEINQDEIIFQISKKEIQYEAKEKIGRELSDDEILVAKKGLEWGLLTGIDIIYDTIFSEIIVNR